MAEVIKGTFEYRPELSRDKSWSFCTYVGDEDFRRRYGTKRFHLVGDNLPTVAIQHEFEVEYDPNYTRGRYFRCLSYRECPAGGREEGIRWLQSDVFYGIGASKAAKIYDQLADRLGNHPIDVIKNDLSVLKSTMSQKAFEKIEASYNRYYSSEEVLNKARFLEVELGLSESQSRRIEKLFSYEEDLESYIKENPYHLYQYGRIPFPLVDAYALRIGVDFVDLDRIYAGLLEVLRRNEENGHTCKDLKELIEDTKRLLYLSMDVDDYVKRVLVYHLSQRRGATNLFAYNRDLGKRIARMDTAIKELRIANFVLHDNESPVKQFNARTRHMSEEEFSCYLDGVVERNTPEGMVLDPSQIKAIKNALSKRFSIITGGPGTGKTTITNVLISCYEELADCGPSKINLIAPTGMAAKRLSEKSGLKARTIHSRFLIGVGSQNEDEDKRKEFTNFAQRQYTIDHSLVILDEASMPDISLVSTFLEYLVTDTVNVVLVGDKDQLNAVGCGAVFHDLLQFFRDTCGNGTSNPVSYLTTTHRQAEGSGIVDVAHRINRGDYRAALSSNEEYEVRLINQGDSAEEVLREMEDQMVEETVKQVRTYGLNETIVLCPQNEGVCGVMSLNKRLQEAFNPKREGEMVMQDRRGMEYRVGDRVMHLRNNKHIVNGDVGYVESITQRSGHRIMTVVYSTEDGMHRERYKSEAMDLVTLCYATTVHKAQGSEYASVVVGISAHQPFGLRRNLFYTAVTRGKSHVSVLGDREGIMRACAGTISSKVNSALYGMLMQGYREGLGHLYLEDVQFVG